MRIIAGIHKNRRLSSPKGLETRPTSSKLREALFNICQSYIQDAVFLDLFAGSGAMGLEALSRGAESATFIDSSKEAVKCILANVKTLQMDEQAIVICADVFKGMERLMKEGRQYDIIYADPPYGALTRKHDESMTYSEKIVKMVDTGTLLKPGAVLFVEEESQSIVDHTDLQTLELRSTRHMGRSTLQQYVKRT